MPVAITGVGAAAGSLRCEASDVADAWGTSARGRFAACAADEDTLTLAWQAAVRALEAAGSDPGSIDGLWWGTPTPPFGQGPSRAYLSATLRLPDTVVGAIVSGTDTCGVQALLAASDAIAAGRCSRALVVVSDDVLPGLGSRHEHRAGAAGSAFVLEAGDGPAILGAATTRLRPVLDRYRGSDEAATRDAYDGRLFREEVFVPSVVGAARALHEATPISAWSLPDPDGRLGRLIAKEVGAGEPPSAGPYAAFGDTGAAAPLLGAIAALGGGGTVGLVAYGGGETVTLTIDVNGAVPGADLLDAVTAEGRPASYATVLRARGQLSPAGEPVQMGVPPGGAGFVRGGAELLSLHGARCTDCGTVSTPPSVHPACTGCGGSSFEIVDLPRAGTVVTFVVNQTMPAPFEAPLPVVIADLVDGTRLQLQGLAGTAFQIDGGIELVLRRYARERGAPVYGYKAAPAATRGQG